MPNLKPPSAAALAALLVAAAALTMGCGGDLAGDRELPEGGETSSVGRDYSFGHPASWTTERRPIPGGSELIQKLGEPMKGVRPVVGTFTRPSTDESFEQNYKALRLISEGLDGDVRVLETKDLDVPGTRGARVTTSESDTGERTTIREQKLFVISGEDLAIVLFARRPADRPEVLDLDAAIEPFRLSE